MRNNYADQDAQAICKQFAGTGDFVEIQAADEDQFWVVDWITVAGVAGTTEVRFGTESTGILFKTSTAGADPEQFVLCPGLYQNGQTKNQALYVKAPNLALVSIRYR